MDSIVQDALTETYSDTERLIVKIAHDFHRKYGNTYGTVEELISIGNESFMKAYNSDKGKSSFVTWLFIQVTHGILDEIRRRTKRQKRLPESTNGLDSVSYSAALAQPPLKFFLHEFLDELTDDAKLVVELVLDTPNDLLEIMREDNGNRKKASASIRQYLLGCGWTVKRIMESFAEITCCLIRD